MAATRIGCDNLVYAPLTTDDGTVLTYGAPVSLPNVMKININPNPSSETLFADDGPADTAATLGKIEVEIDKAALSITEKASLLGHKKDSNGVLVYSANDTAPWVAIGFRTLRSDGTYRYIWLLKGKFMEPEDNNETKGDSISFQNDTIKGEFAKVNKSFTVDGETKKPWKMEVDEDDAAAAGAISDWFTTVYLPGATVTP